MGEALHGMRWMLMLVCLVVFLLVFAAMFYSIWKHHRSQSGGKSNFHASMAVEICWATAPFAIVVLLVWPSVRVILAG